MLKSYEGTIDENGVIRLKEPVKLHEGRQVIVTVLPEESPLDTALLSEAALAEDWNRPEEYEAWADLQQEQ